MSRPCLTCKHDSPCSDPQQTPCAFCGEGYMYYDPVILTDKEEDEIMQNWIEKQRKNKEK